MKTLSSLYEAKGGTAPIVILDTDFGIDVDDLMDVEVCHKLHESGEIVLAATIGCMNPNEYPKVGPALEGMARFHGNYDCQVGVIPSGGLTGQSDYYAGTVANQLMPTKLSKDYPSSTDVYRRVLANAPDESVIIHVVGTQDAVNLLMNSAADSISSLTGAQLVAKKVRAISVVSGDYPSGVASYNFFQSLASCAWINNVASNVRIIYSGINQATDGGTNIIMGGRRYTQLFPAGHPVRKAMASVSPTFVGRPMWGPWTIVALIRGFADRWSQYATLTGPGSNSVNLGTGNNTWDGVTVLKNQAYLTRVKETEELAAECESYLYRPPNVKPPLKLDPWVELWRLSANVAGTQNGPKLNATLRALNNYVLGLKEAGIWTKLKFIAPFCGDNLATALVPLKYNIRAGSALMLPNSLVESDYSQAEGVNCSAVGKYVDTNQVCSTLGLTATSHSIGFYSRTHAPQTSAGDIGRFENGTSDLQIISSFSAGFPNSYFDTMANSGNGRLNSSSPVAATTRLFVGTRTSAAVAKLFRDGVQLGATLTTTLGALPGGTILVGTENGASCAAKKYTHAFLGLGLTDLDVAILTQCVNDLESALGRAV